MIIDIRQLDKNDIKTVRYESDQEGFQHINKLLADFHSGKTLFDQPGEQLIGFQMDNKFVGICGLNREPTNDTLGRLDRLYVLRRYRNRGIGSKLVSYLVKHAKESFIGVVVNVGEQDIGPFYEARGFKQMMNNDSYSHIHLF